MILLSLLACKLDATPGEGTDTATSPDLESRDPFSPPADLLEGHAVDGCSLYEETSCQEGVEYTCAVYDSRIADFSSEIDELFERVLLYERWTDLYHQPDGLTADRDFVGETLAGSPEDEWGSLEHFAEYDMGDAALWSGVALGSTALRYLNTGTAADYERMETRARAVQSLFEVSGIPGYLVRNFFSWYPDEEPPHTDAHLVKGPEHEPDHVEQAFDPVNAPDLDPWWLETEGIPMWNGNPSLDQYGGPMVAYPLVRPLLQDSELADRMSGSILCYLNRLQRIDLINLQDNPDASALVQAYMAGGTLKLDDDDIDLSAIDTISLWVLRQPNSLNAETFDSSCPDGPQTEPVQVLDATAPDFLIDMLGLISSMASGSTEMEQAIDHVYAPSIRGGDAGHMMHLAVQAWHYTGEQVYLDFLQDTLMDEVRAHEVVLTTGALHMPKWCTAYYGPHITFPAEWSLANLLPEDHELRQIMLRVMEEEMWEKLIVGHANAKFELIFAALLPDAADADMALQESLESVRSLGGNGGVLTDPRRKYTLDSQWVIDNLPDGIEVDCPTVEERAFCEDGYEFMGIPVPGETISFECSGAVDECVLDDGLCATAFASEPMPMEYRVWEDFLWQRDPFKLGRSFGVEGEGQSPGLDLIEIFWLARTYGFLDNGEGQVLAWQETGSCED